MSRLSPTAVVLSILVCGCSSSLQPPPAAHSTDLLIRSAPERLAMDPSLRSSIDSLMERAVADRIAPGGAVAVGRHGRLAHLAGYGRTDWIEKAPEVTDSTIYDLASLTKVVATTTAAMLLEEDGLLDLERPVGDFLPSFRNGDKKAITVRMLLTHRSGMSTQMLHREARGREQYLEKISTRPLSWQPGTRTNYSDWNMITLQFVIESVADRPMDELLTKRVFRPLKMRDTRYVPPPTLRSRIAPTEMQEWRGGLVHGEVHDENAWALGGVAGHAGLFSSARDLAVFAQMMLNGGEYGSVRIFRPETVARWTARQHRDASRALGWDTPSPGSSAGSFFSPRSFGHTGFTGTSLWIDPEKDLFLILLTNRINPTRENPAIAVLRRSIADAVQQRVRDARVQDWEEKMGSEFSY